MAGCVLRVRKEDFDSKEFLHSANIENATLIQGGFNLTVSKNENLDTQIFEAEEFLKNNTETLRSLTSILSPDVPELNFGIWRNSSPVQSILLPLSIITQCSELGIEIRTSIYEVNDR